jgi:hypothetical protein
MEDRGGILHGIERTLILHRVEQFLIGFRQRYGLDPGHKECAEGSKYHPFDALVFSYYCDCSG